MHHCRSSNSGNHFFTPVINFTFHQVVIPMDKVCLPSKPVLEAKNLTRCCLFIMSPFFSHPLNLPRQDFPLGENQSIMTSAEQFFTYGVLKSRPDNDITDGLGLPDPTLLGALAVTWIILYFSLRGGVGGQGKVVETIDKTLGIIFSNRLLTLRPFSPTWSFSLSLSGD